MSSSIVMASISGELPTCQPNLMPFHIAHDGPALISTFMRVEPAKELIGGPPEKSIGSGSEDTLNPQLSSSSNTDETVEAVQGGDASTTKEQLGAACNEDLATIGDGEKITVDSVDAEIPETAKSEEYVQANPTRFISTFRGRIVQGLNVNVPEGYTGLVLRAPEPNEKQGTNNSKSPDPEPASKSRPLRAKGKKTAATKPKGKGRLTRSAVSKRAIDVDEEDEDAMAVDSGKNLENDAEQTLVEDPLPDEPASIRRLVPSAQFSSFMLWHPDLPVDEGRDEYFRVLHEWTRLAGEIHQVENL